MTKKKRKIKQLHTLAGTLNLDYFNSSIFLYLTILIFLVGIYINSRTNMVKDEENLNEKGFSKQSLINSNQNRIINIREISFKKKNFDNPPKISNKSNIDKRRPYNFQNFQDRDKIRNIENSKNTNIESKAEFVDFIINNFNPINSKHINSKKINGSNEEFFNPEITPSITKVKEIPTLKNKDNYLTDNQINIKNKAEIGNKSTTFSNDDQMLTEEINLNSIEITNKLIQNNSKLKKNPEEFGKTDEWIKVKFDITNNRWDRVELRGLEFNNLISYMYNKIEHLKNINYSKVIKIENPKIEISPFVLSIYNYDGKDYRLEIPSGSDKLYCFVRKSNISAQHDPISELKKLKLLLQKFQSLR